MFISVIICAHNEENFISIPLRSLKSQLRKSDELIVICDSCDDNTAEISKKYTKKVFNVKFKNGSKVRNFGSEKSIGDILVFCDADTLFINNYLEEIRKAVANGSEYGGAPFRPESRHLISKYFCWTVNKFNKKLKTFGGNCFVIKELFENSGKWNDKIKIGEDTEFGERLYKLKANYKFLDNTFITPSERKFRKNGYLRHLIWNIKNAYLYKNKKDKFLHNQINDLE